MVNKDKYKVYTSVFMMEGCDLYSDTDTDPIITAELDAISELAFDGEGNSLPYSISVSIFGQEWDRENYLFEDKPATFRRWDQKVAVHVIVFNSEIDKRLYDCNDKVIIEKYGV
tara:strand:- start:338 stop:679 length:342 start_codon:yes stop_codon:yes gene_type:complete